MLMHLVFVAHYDDKAMTNYKNDLIKYGLGAPPEEVVNEVQAIADLSQCTAYEVHLARSLNKKDATEKKTAVLKYMALFAHVPTSSVQPTLLKAAQEVAAK